MNREEIDNAVYKKIGFCFWEEHMTKEELKEISELKKPTQLVLEKIVEIVVKNEYWSKVAKKRENLAMIRKSLLDDLIILTPEERSGDPYTYDMCIVVHTKLHEGVSKQDVRPWSCRDYALDYIAERVYASNKKWRVRSQTTLINEWGTESYEVHAVDYESKRQ